MASEHRSGGSIAGERKGRRDEGKEGLRLVTYTKGAGVRLLVLSCPVPLLPHRPVTRSEAKEDRETKQQMFTWGPVC